MLEMEKSVIRTEHYPVFCTSKTSLNLPNTFQQGSANLIFEILSKRSTTFLLELPFDLMHTATKKNPNPKSNSNSILNFIALIEHFEYSLQTLLTVM